MTQGATGVLAPDALEANRSGALTDLQRKGLRSSDRAARKNNFVLVPLLVILGIVLVRATGPAQSAWMRPYAGAGALVFAAVLLLRSLGAWDKLGDDLQNGRVEWIEGALGKRIIQGRSRNFHYFDIAGRSFEVSGGAYRAVPDAGIFRLYFLPRSKRVVNLEQLADRPLPPDLLKSPTEAMKILASAVRSHDRTEVAEAKATFAAMKHTWTLETREATPPPPGERDPRPLAEAIVGRWRTGFLTVDFRPNGTVEVTTVGGHTKNGRWRVDGEGRLHADAMSQDQVAQAWVADDALTITVEEGSLTFRRA